MSHSHFNQPAEYAKHSQVQEMMGMYAIKGTQFYSDDVVLDIGSGDGRLTAEIAKQVESIVGIDNQQKCVEEAKLRHAQTGKIGFTVLDARKIAEKYQKDFTKITSFSTLHWFNAEDTASILRQMHAVLRPGGEIILMVPAHHELLYDSIDEVRGFWRKRTHQAIISSTPDRQFYDQAAYQQLIGEAGFQGQVTTVRMPIYFQTKENLQSWVKQWLPDLHNLKTEKDKDMFLEDILNAYLKRQELPQHHKGPVCLNLCYLKVKASNDPALSQAYRNHRLFARKPVHPANSAPHPRSKL